MTHQRQVPGAQRATGFRRGNVHTRQRKSDYTQSVATRNGSRDGVMTMDADGRITFINATAESATGWMYDEAQGVASDVVFRIADYDGRAVPNPVTRAMRAGASLTSPDAVMLSARNGATTPINFSVDLVHNDAGAVNGAVLAFRPALLFHRNNVQPNPDANVATSEIRYRRLFEAAQDGILILDAESLTIIDANQFMTDMLGYTRADLIGKQLWEIGFSRDKLASQSLDLELREKGYVRYAHLPLEKRNGERAEVEFITNVYEMGERTVAQCNIRDISERRRLERQVEEQMTALTELHRRKDEFLAMLSHELRNPLAPIANAVQLLRLQTDADPVQQRVHQIIERQVVQLSRLVDDLMEVSRISTGQVTLRLDPVLVNALVERAIDATRPVATQRGQHIAVALCSEPVSVQGDVARLEQVLVNLLTNASKYTDEGGRISVAVTQGGGECMISVADSGIGIEASLLPHIFELFTQAPSSLERAGGGLGIGLALVDRLVKMHHGSVVASSVVGRGSTFVVRLPLLPSRVPDKHATPFLPNVGRPPASGVRVLVVDDNVDTAETLALIMKAMGHDVRRVHDGPSVMAAAIDHRPHVVLLDVGLPGADGYEVAIQLRKEPVLSQTVLVAVTGYAHEADRKRAFAAGFDHHVVKPADLDVLKAILGATAQQIAMRAR